MSKSAAEPGSEDAAAPEPTVAAPELPYRPRDPRRYRPRIGLIGCGAITVEHLTAYRRAGYDVAAFCDLDRERAAARQAEFYPQADIYDDHRALLERDDIAVVDVTTHPPDRPPLVEAALRAGKHVLSQKPFVLDLDDGDRLVRVAESAGRRLAVNQNGRWAPHFSYMRHAVAAGLVGELLGVHCSVHWDHNWVLGTPFEEVRHLILYDFAIHWFDMLTTLMGDRPPLRVYASFARSAVQEARPALLGQALVEYEGAQASLVFDGDTKFGPRDTTTVVGSLGTLASKGPDFRHQRVLLHTAAGRAEPELEGNWFPDGFHGTMGELLSAIEEEREPSHSGRNNLASLALCFAAVASAERHEPVVPGSVRRLKPAAR